VKCVELLEIVRRVGFADWRFRVDEVDPGGHLFVQVEFDAPCIVSGRAQVQRGRKWLLSAHMTESEVVQTCLLAVLQATEHEARETFTYEGERVFGPHLDVRWLLNTPVEKRPTPTEQGQEGGAS
jgi:hypothetical protein